MKPHPLNIKGLFKALEKQKSCSLFRSFVTYVIYVLSKKLIKKYYLIMLGIVNVQSTQISTFYSTYIFKSNASSWDAQSPQKTSNMFDNELIAQSHLRKTEIGK